MVSLCLGRTHVCASACLLEVPPAKPMTQFISLGGAATSIIFVMTNVLLRQTQTYFCRDKTFVTKHNFVATKVFCRDKHTFVASNMCLSSNISFYAGLIDTPFSSFHWRLPSTSFFHASPSGDQQCDVLVFVPISNVTGSSTLQIFRGTSHLWWWLFPLSHFLWLRHAQDSTSTGVLKSVCIKQLSCTLDL